MPLALVVIGLMMIVTGARDTYGAFGNQLVKDFTGEGNFTYWIAGIGAVGALGYAEPLRVFSRLFMALIIIVMVLSNGGFFDKLTDALASGPVAPPKNENGDTASAVTPTNASFDADSFNPSTFVMPGLGDIWNAIGGTTTETKDQSRVSDAQDNFSTVVNVVKTFFGFGF